MGLATARAFAEAGAAVVLADINDEALRTATHDLTSAGHQAIGVTCDVSDEAQVAAMVERAGASFGRLDMAFNNAGIQVPPSDAADELAEHFDRVNAINLRGVWTCMKHELRHMRAQGSGAIVNCSSLRGPRRLPSRAAFAVAAAKDVFLARGVGPDQLPPAGGPLLPTNEASEARRAAFVEQSVGPVAPGVVQYTSDPLFHDL